MKKILHFCATMMLCLALYSCEKENIDPYPDKYEITCADYTMLHVGNYWIYQRYKIDPSGYTTPLNKFDSCYVSGDTIIRSQTYYKVYRTSLSPYPNIQYLRDSAQYLINHQGLKLFSPTDFTTVFTSHFLTIPDTVAYIYLKMDEQSQPVNSPAGVYTTLNARTTYEFRPPYNNHGDIRYHHCRYAINVGIVSETLGFFMVQGDGYEHRLVRYHIAP